MTKVNIFCVENWSEKLTARESVEPLLRYIEQAGRARVLHVRVLDEGSLETAVRRWVQRRYENFPLGYFAFHGSPGKIWLGRRSVSLERLGELLEGKCKGKTLYFGSCSVLDVPRRRIERFLATSGARAVAGYKNDVDWFEGAALDLLVFDCLTYYDRRIDLVDNWLRENHQALARRLGFTMVRA